MSCYTQLSMPERMRLYTFLEMGLSKAQIAVRLGRHKSTIYREVQRNRRSIGYLPGIAHRKSQKRRANKPGKIRAQRRLYDYILRGLKLGWSPEQIAGRLKRKYRGYGDTFFIDEVFVKIGGKQHYLWRAVDQDGEVVDVYLQARRDGTAVTTRLPSGSSNDCYEAMVVSPGRS